MVHKTLHRNYGLSNTDLPKLRNYGCELGCYGRVALSPLVVPVLLIMLEIR